MRAILGVGTPMVGDGLTDAAVNARWRRSRTRFPNTSIEPESSGWSRPGMGRGSPGARMEILGARAECPGAAPIGYGGCCGTAPAPRRARRALHDDADRHRRGQSGRRWSPASTDAALGTLADTWSAAPNAASHSIAQRNLLERGAFLENKAIVTLLEQAL